MRIQELNGFYSQPLGRAYLSDFPEVSRFFTYDPGQIEGFAARLKHLSAKKKGQLQLLAETLRQDNLQLGCGDKTLKNISLLEKGLAVAVVTGQQPGLLTGPLYTVYKAMGAIKLAQELSAELNHPVVPVFWIGADDHDFEEINHIFVPTSEGPKKITLTEKPAGRFSLGHVPVPQEVPLFLQQLEELTPPVGWQQEGLALLRETARQSENLAQWFGRLMTFLFKDDGLVLMNPVLPPLRRLSAGLFHRAVKTAPEVDRLLQRACQEVTAAGFSPQVQSEEDKLHLFIYIKGQRTALYLKKDQFTDRQGVNTWEKEQLAQLSLNSPELFSPDVVLRPVVQEELLPVLAYVAGPGEISYFALLKNIFQHFGQEMPVVYPRPNMTLVEPLVEKLLTKYQVPLRLLPAGLGGFIDAYVERTDEVGIEGIFADFRSVLREKQTNIVKEVASINPELKGLGKENLRRLLRVIDSFEDKVKQRHRKNNQVAIRQLNKVNAMLHPLGQWQERVYNIFPYLMKYQPDLLKEIYHAIRLFDWRQKIIFFD
ncbi:MAG: bacillithiol biosynthesis cysteine-adding enzyme BshC [Bacillota bacterium]